MDIPLIELHQHSAGTSFTTWLPTWTYDVKFAGNWHTGLTGVQVIDLLSDEEDTDQLVQIVHDLGPEEEMELAVVLKWLEEE